MGAAAGALMLGTVGTARALIPVFDGAAVAEMVRQIGEDEKAFALQVQKYLLQAKQYIGENFSWVTQYGQYATQLSQAFNESLMLLNFVHHPTYGAAMGMMNTVGIGNSLPFSPYSALNLINGSSYGQGGFAAIGGLLNSLSSLANTSLAANRLYTPTDGSWASQQLVDNANGIAGAQGTAAAAFNDYRNHMGVLPVLRQNAASATTMKDAADTGNQLLAETAWNMNQLGQVNALAWMTEQQRWARVQRDEERLACELEQFRSATPQPCPKGDNGAVAGGGGGANGGSDAIPVPPVPPLPVNTGAPIAIQPDPPVPAPPAPPLPPPDFEPPAPVQAPPQVANPPPPPQTQAGVLQ